MAAEKPGPSDDADLERIAKEASWLLSAFESEWLELGPVGLFSPRVGGSRIATRGEYQRWMQDAQSWGLQALRSCERPAGLYRDSVRVDETLRTAGQEVTKHVAGDAPQAIHEALTTYLAHVSQPSA